VTAIRWTEQAVADLEAIRDYVARDSARYATLLVERLIASLDQVSQFPEIGRVVPEYQRPDIRELILGSYRCQLRYLQRPLAHQKGQDSPSCRIARRLQDGGQPILLIVSFNHTVE
jgi:plasmid stabilization system protein ParE